MDRRYMTCALAVATILATVLLYTPLYSAPPLKVGEKFTYYGSYSVEASDYGTLIGIKCTISLEITKVTNSGFTYTLTARIDEVNINEELKKALEALSKSLGQNLLFRPGMVFSYNGSYPWNLKAEKPSLPSIASFVTAFQALESGNFNSFAKVITQPNIGGDGCSYYYNPSTLPKSRVLSSSSEGTIMNVIKYRIYTKCVYDDRGLLLYGKSGVRLEAPNGKWVTFSIEIRRSDYLATSAFALPSWIYIAIGGAGGGAAVGAALFFVRRRRETTPITAESTQPETGPQQPYTPQPPSYQQPPYPGAQPAQPPQPGYAQYPQQPYGYQQPTPQYKVCPYCGTVHTPDARFCRKCGRPLP